MVTKNKTKKMYFKVHIPNLLKEICDHGLLHKSGVLVTPINEMKRKLQELAAIAIKINDPRLNLWCYEQAIYEVDPLSNEYNKTLNKLKKQVEKMEKLEK